ncbi:sugar-transfer associated ATP-grasp domain-containing protein [Cyclonatronum proteinivorum]|nr:sugar-transfer associated ATP-grasp domain-containing protein [Cyclonatronum proteinivorum]
MYLDKLDYFFDIANSSFKYSFNKHKKLKSSMEIYHDFIKWYMQFEEVDRTYFLRGNDVGGSNTIVFPTRMCVKIRNEYNNINSGRDYTIILRDKYLFAKYCAIHNIPTPKTYGLFKNNHLNWLEEPEIGTPLFVKENNGIGGSSLITGKYLGANKLMCNDITIDMFDLSINKTLLIQEKIHQIKTFQDINEHAVNTLKLTTTIVNGKVKTHFGFVRFGTSKSGIMDNLNNGSIFVPVNVASGELGEMGFYKFAYNDPNDIGYAITHPETSKEIVNFKVPYFTEAKKLVEKSHLCFSDVYSIGWDIAFTLSGPILIEANSAWDTSIGQVVAGSNIIEQIFPDNSEIKGFKNKYQYSLYNLK